MIDKKYPTTLEYDLKILESMSGNPQDEEIEQLVQSKPDLWRYKLAVIHRVNQKELLHNQLMYCQLLLTIMNRSLKLIKQAESDESIKLTARDFKALYLAPVKQYGEHEDPGILIKNRIVLRHYLQEYLIHQ